jgi:hypothetical protein
MLIKGAAWLVPLRSRASSMLSLNCNVTATGASQDWRDQFHQIAFCAATGDSEDEGNPRLA